MPPPPPMEGFFFAKQMLCRNMKKRSSAKRREAINIGLRPLQIGTTARPCKERLDQPTPHYRGLIGKESAGRRENIQAMIKQADIDKLK
jgi:hypothetical protein